MTDDGTVTVELGRGWPVDITIARFAVIGLIPPGPDQAVTGASLVVVTDEEWEVDVSIGHTFPVREQVWRLDDVTLIGNDDYRVTLSRVGTA